MICLAAVGTGAGLVQGADAAEPVGDVPGQAESGPLPHRPLLQHRDAHRRPALQRSADVVAANPSAQSGRHSTV